MSISSWEQASVDMLSDLLVAATGGDSALSLRECLRQVWSAMENERPTEEVLNAILDGFEV